MCMFRKKSYIIKSSETIVLKYFNTLHILIHQTPDFNIDLGTIELPKCTISPNHKVYFYKYHRLY